MDAWLIASLLVIFIWGLWGVMLKYAGLYMEWYYVYAGSALGAFIIYAIFIILLTLTGKLSVSLQVKPLTIAAAGGLMGALGGIFMVLALKMGQASIVVPLTALYPLVTVLASYAILGEPMTARKIAGLILAIIAVILLSTSE
ncbi:MAG: EamA family transporter [Thermoprotei archaeon]|nr:EamA family transporter [Thermoprotei archaeon]